MMLQEGVKEGKSDTLRKKWGKQPTDYGGSILALTLSADGALHIAAPSPPPFPHPKARGLLE